MKFAPLRDPRTVRRQVSGLAGILKQITDELKALQSEKRGASLVKAVIKSVDSLDSKVCQREFLLVKAIIIHPLRRQLKCKAGLVGSDLRNLFQNS